MNQDRWLPAFFVLGLTTAALAALAKAVVPPNVLPAWREVAFPLLAVVITLAASAVLLRARFPDRDPTFLVVALALALLGSTLGYGGWLIYDTSECEGPPWRAVYLQPDLYGSLASLDAPPGFQLFEEPSDGELVLDHADLRGRFGNATWGHGSYEPESTGSWDDVRFDLRVTRRPSGHPQDAVLHAWFVGDGAREEAEERTVAFLGNLTDADRSTLEAWSEDLLGSPVDPRLSYTHELNLQANFSLGDLTRSLGGADEVEILDHEHPRYAIVGGEGWEINLRTPQHRVQGSVDDTPVELWVGSAGQSWFVMDQDPRPSRSTVRSMLATTYGELGMDVEVPEEFGVEAGSVC